MDTFQIIEHMSYDWMIVTYFFLGGLSSGSYILSVAANYWKKDLQPVAKTAAVISILSVSLGLFFLLIDLGRPIQFWRLLITIVPTSVLSWGVWGLNVFFAINAAYIWFLQTGNNNYAKKAAYLGLPFALFVGSYTALLLGQAPGRILWHSPLLPLLFLLGGIISAIALVMLVTVITGKRDVSTNLGKYVTGLIALEIGLIAVEIINLYNGSAKAVEMANLLVNGDLSFLFWGVEIFLGAAIPLSILFSKKSSFSLQAVATVLILIGIYTMRYIVVVGSQLPTF